ncbi:MAG: DUF192 domain-containing protein [Nitrospiraceae bacterium]
MRLTGLIGFLLWVATSQTMMPDAAGEKLEEPIVSVTTPQKETIFAELADTTEKRARGLMFRQSLAANRGMLFIFPEPQQWTFWMKNTRISLDIIWMDQQKRIVYIERSVPGCSRSDDGCPQYQSTYDALYVLEVAAGMADALKLQRGVKLQFQLPPSPHAQ